MEAKPPEPAPKAPTPPPPPDAKTIPKEPAAAKPPVEPTSEERVAERIARLREKHPEAPPPPPRPGPEDGARVREAVERVRQRVEATASPPPPPAGAPGTGSGAGPVGVRAEGGNVLSEVRLRSYYNRIWEHVNSYWAIPEPLKGRGHTVIVSAVIDRQGKILRSWIEVKSGSSAFDQSALSALDRAQPLPPPPPEIPNEWIEVGFRFHGE